MHVKDWILPGPTKKRRYRRILLYLQKMCLFGRMEHILKQSHDIMQCVRPLNCCAIALVALLTKNLKTPGRYELDIQPQPSRWGCHCHQLQNQPFGFCGRFGTASNFNRSFKMHLIGFLLHAPKHERKSALKIPDVLSLKTRKAMFPASERKYTAASWEVQVP